MRRGGVCAPAKRRSEKGLARTLVTPPLTGVVLVDAEGEIHVGHLALHALAPFAKGPWRWMLRLVPSWGYAVVAKSRHVWGRDDTCSMPRPCVT